MMTHHSMSSDLGAAHVVCLTSCKSVRPTINSLVTDYATPENLESSHSTVGCENISSVDNTHTPPDIYKSMVKCAEKGDYAAAIYLFALAGTYTYYDRLRVVDTTAHQAH